MQYNDVTERWWKRWAQIVFWEAEDLAVLHQRERQCPQNYAHPFQVSHDMKTMEAMQIKYELRPYWADGTREFQAENKAFRFKGLADEIAPPIWSAMERQGDRPHIEILHECDKEVWGQRLALQPDRSKPTTAMPTGELDPSKRREYQRRFQGAMSDD